MVRRLVAIYNPGGEPLCSTGVFNGLVDVLIDAHEAVRVVMLTPRVVTQMVPETVEEILARYEDESKLLLREKAADLLQSEEGKEKPETLAVLRGVSEQCKRGTKRKLAEIGAEASERDGVLVGGEDIPPILGPADYAVQFEEGNMAALVQRTLFPLLLKIIAEEIAREIFVKQCESKKPADVKCEIQDNPEVFIAQCRERLALRLASEFSLRLGDKGELRTIEEEGPGKEALSAQLYSENVSDLIFLIAVLSSQSRESGT